MDENIFVVKNSFPHVKRAVNKNRFEFINWLN